MRHNHPESKKWITFASSREVFIVDGNVQENHWYFLSNGFQFWFEILQLSVSQRTVWNKDQEGHGRKFIFRQWVCGYDLYSCRRFIQRKRVIIQVCPSHYCRQQAKKNSFCPAIPRDNMISIHLGFERRVTKRIALRTSTMST